MFVLLLCIISPDGSFTLLGFQGLLVVWVVFHVDAAQAEWITLPALAVPSTGQQISGHAAAMTAPASIEPVEVFHKEIGQV
jgi:hypothetical protein